MKRNRLFRMGLLSLSPALSLTGLLALARVQPSPQQAEQQTKSAEQKAPPEQAGKKGVAFPLSLFANAQPDDYLEDETPCSRCHKRAHANFQASPHKPYVLDPHAPKDKQGCQSCHGPGGPHIAHLENPEERYHYVVSYSRVTPMQGSMVCLRCHNDTMTVAHWKRTGHAQANVGCVDCHGIHQDPLNQDPVATVGRRMKSIRSQVFVAAAPARKLLKADEPTLCGACHAKETNEFRHNFHHPVPEGRLTCSDCHEIHPRRANEKLAAAHTRLRPTRELCVTCHAETAGPFVFEHDPAVGLTGEGCMECHRPHGSQNPRILNVFSRGLCNQCHTDKNNGHHPGRTCWQAGCHVAVHGSNTDPLLLRR